MSDEKSDPPRDPVTTVRPYARIRIIAAIIIIIAALLALGYHSLSG
jgi:hypothetical protein